MLLFFQAGLVEAAKEVNPYSVYVYGFLVACMIAVIFWLVREKAKAEAAKDEAFKTLVEVNQASRDFALKTQMSNDMTIVADKQDRIVTQLDKIEAKLDTLVSNLS